MHQKRACLIRNAPLLAGVCSNAEMVAEFARKVQKPISTPAFTTVSACSSRPQLVSSGAFLLSDPLCSCSGPRSDSGLRALTSVSRSAAPAAWMAASAEGDGGSPRR